MKEGVFEKDGRKKRNIYFPFLLRSVLWHIYMRIAHMSIQTRKVYYKQKPIEA